jgi:hypothetical protein
MDTKYTHHMHPHPTCSSCFCFLFYFQLFLVYIFLGASFLSSNIITKISKSFLLNNKFLHMFNVFNCHRYPQLQVTNPTGPLRIYHRRTSIRQNQWTIIGRITILNIIHMYRCLNSKAFVICNFFDISKDNVGRQVIFYPFNKW